MAKAIKIWYNEDGELLFDNRNDPSIDIETDYKGDTILATEDGNSSPLNYSVNDDNELIFKK